MANSVKFGVCTQSAPDPKVILDFLQLIYSIGTMFLLCCCYNLTLFLFCSM